MTRQTPKSLSDHRRAALDLIRHVKATRRRFRTPPPVYRVFMRQLACELAEIRALRAQ